MRTTLILWIGNTLRADEGPDVHLLEFLRADHPGLPGITCLDGDTPSFTLALQVEDYDDLAVPDAAQLQSPGWCQPPSLKLRRES